MRQRKAHSSSLDIIMDSSMDDASLGSSSTKQKDSIHQIPLYFGFLVIILMSLLYGGVYLIDRSLPSAYLKGDEAKNPNEFIAERAQQILEGLTDIGPRIVGSQANEELAVKYLNEEVKKIVENAHTSQKITVDNQLVSGSYYLGFKPDGLINAYANVQNIVVKISGKRTNDSILINAHFDSVPTSPGASDDGIMVATMLETLRKLTQTEQKYERDIIFLMNGAEESPLHAAHGFITQHPWAKSCRTIINLEAAGHGGKAITFQSGPKRSSALISHYISVPYPYAQSAGEEIFQSNLIPSDTDFRLFRDFGHLNGFDMAFAQNGYRYHTKYDSFKEIELGSYQHIGSNLLALLRSLALDSEVMEDDDSKVVYFDIFSWFILSYSTLAACIMNILIAIASLATALISFPKLQLRINLFNLWYVIRLTVSIIGSWILAVGCAVIIALLIDWTGNTMTWYGSPIIIFGLYVAPALGVMTGTMWLCSRFINHGGRSLSAQSQIQMHIIRLIWSFVLFIGSVIGLRSVYVILIPVLFNTIASLLIFLTKWQHSIRKWQITIFIFTIIPSIISMYMGVSIFSLFIPITGRIGANRNPDLIISMLTCLILLLVATHYLHYFRLIRKSYWIPIILLIGFLITFIVAVTPAAFPYSGDSKSPTPQRFMIYHTNRIHHAYNNSEPVIEQSGIFILNNDRNSPNSVKKYINLTDNPYAISQDCEKYLACGMPLSSARMVALVDTSTWIPFEKATINEPTTMEYSTEKISTTIKQYKFKVTGPDHLTVFARVKEGAMATTSLTEQKTDHLMFINFVYGKIKTPLEFTIDVESDNLDRPLLDFVISGKYFYFTEKELIGEKFAQFIALFPDWADVSPALANYESYVL